MSALTTPPARLELWGGLECTVNRVRGRYFDQLAMCGHDGRDDDLARVAALGVRTLRYPVLWEHVSPERPDRREWARSDARLGQLRGLGVRPIVGLVHHGSGPRYTDLLDPAFAEGLAAHAAAVARRYPWVELYTPVNEPLTTARFSALYGVWYPHARDGLLFARALLNQCKAVALAMRAIRRVRPDARLVQTEDLGKTHSTEALRYQADFENERRWATFDLLCGRVDRHHPLAGFFRYLGVADGEVGWFADHPCPPDLVGANHYLTSERFLDERLDRYPPGTHGGNGRHAYADVEAARVCALAGPECLLREAWERYRLPLAVTEAHLGCTREEQMRWLAEVWRAAGRLREAGVEVRAVTAWSLFGAHNWDSLVTREGGAYEPGAFDLAGGRPRATALAGLVRQLTSGAEPDHPALDGPGWWRRPERLCYPWHGPPPTAPAASARQRPVLIAGAAGALGGALGRACASRGLAHRLLARGELDIAEPASVEAALAAHGPWAVINAAGYSRVDQAEANADRCRRENVRGPVTLAEACARRGLPLVTYSSDLVFDGGRARPYRESDPAAPLGTYGRSKQEAEGAVLRAHAGALVVRSGAFFGACQGRSFVARVLAALGRGRPVAAADDWTVSPTYLPDLAHASLDLLLDGESGLWHLANRGATTWYELARSSARGAGLDEGLVEGRPARSFAWAAPRPAYSALGSERGRLLPALEDALGRFLGEWRLAPAG